MTLLPTGKAQRDDAAAVIQLEHIAGRFPRAYEHRLNAAMTDVGKIGQKATIHTQRPEEFRDREGECDWMPDLLSS